jgi:hypothetical protein
VNSRVELFQRLVRPMQRHDMDEFRHLGEDEATAVGFELARRVRLRPERNPRLPLSLAEVARTGRDEEGRRAALELVRRKFAPDG